MASVPPTIRAPARLVDGLERLRDLTVTIARAWAARANASTTPAQERALLRLIGVSGVDGAGRPLASEVVDRLVAGRPSRLAGGVTLPFTVALAEYDLSPQDLAVEVAGGSVDLDLEAQLLREPDRRASAELEARRLVSTAMDRIDANRTARRELLGLLGDPVRPWVGGIIGSAAVGTAVGEAVDLVGAGADVVRVRVPAIRELADRLLDEGVQPPPPWAQRSSPADLETPADAPAGSQRGLAELRQVLDREAAERRRYVRLSTLTSALGAPDQAVVAAFERVDVAEVDTIGEIVNAGVDPDRALADHAFAHRLFGRAGTYLLLDAGPLVVGPDMTRGIPSSPAARAGRAFALQALAIEFAHADGIGDDWLLAGAIPAWLSDERDPATQALAGVVLRRAAFPGIPLAFVEPELGDVSAVRWRYLVAASLALGGEAGLIARRPGSGGMALAATETRVAAAIGAQIARPSPEPAVGDAVMDQAGTALDEAITTLERLADGGWRAVLGDPMASPGRSRLGAEGVVERTEPFDPLAS